MGGNIFLQILLVTEIFTAGVLTAIGFRYAKAHLDSKKDTPQVDTAPPPDIHIKVPPVIDEKVVAASRQKVDDALRRAVGQFEHDLNVSSEEINNLVKRLATNIVSDELQNYQNQLSQLNAKAQLEMNGIREEVAKHQEELKAKLNLEMTHEKQLLMKQIDTKLADAVGSFLLNTLGHNVDLGNQQAYLLDMLEQHKNDFKKEVDDEVNAT